MISTEFSNESFVISLLKTTVWTFAALVVSYILLNLSRLVINFFEKNVTPWVYKITDKSKIIMKKDYDTLNTNYKILEERLEKERENRLRIQSERDEIEKQLQDAFVNQKKPDNKTIQTIYDFDTNVEDSDFFTNVDRHLRKKNLLDTFSTEFVKIDQGEQFSQEEILIKELLKLDLIKRVKNMLQSATYQFTDKGLRYKNYFVHNVLLNG